MLIAWTSDMMWQKQHFISVVFLLKAKPQSGTLLVTQQSRLRTPNAGSPGLLPRQGARSDMPQLRPSAATAPTTTKKKIIKQTKNSTSVSSWKKLRKFLLRDTLQNSWPLLFTTVKFTLNKETLKNCHSQEKPTETWQLNEMCHHQWDTGTGKDSFNLKDRGKIHLKYYSLFFKVWKIFLGKKVPLCWASTEQWSCAS